MKYFANKHLHICLKTLLLLQQVAGGEPILLFVITLNVMTHKPEVNLLPPGSMSCHSQWCTWGIMEQCATRAKEPTPVNYTRPAIIPDSPCSLRTSVPAPPQETIAAGRSGVRPICELNHTLPRGVAMAMLVNFPASKVCVCVCVCAALNWSAHLQHHTASLCSSVGDSTENTFWKWKSVNVEDIKTKVGKNIFGILLVKIKKKKV